MNYNCFPEPPLDPPEYWGRFEPEGPSLDEVEDALAIAERETLAVLFSLSGNVDNLQADELTPMLTLEDWCEEWPDWFPGVPIPSREAFAPLLASIAVLVDAADAVANWEEPEPYECECRKKRCEYCGSADY
jgi:hypothetical protein